MDVEYSDGVVEWVLENMVLAGVSDGVLPHREIPAYGGGEVASVLGDICACGGGYAVRIACWRFWSPSVSVWFPHMHCDRMCFVMSDPLLFTSL